MALVLRGGENSCSPTRTRDASRRAPAETSEYATGSSFTSRDGRRRRGRERSTLKFLKFYFFLCRKLTIILNCSLLKSFCDNIILDLFFLIKDRFDHLDAANWCKFEAGFLTAKKYSFIIYAILHLRLNILEMINISLIQGTIFKNFYAVSKIHLGRK